MCYEEFKFEDIEVGDELQWKILYSGLIYGQCYKVASIRNNIAYIENDGVLTSVSGNDTYWNLIKQNNTASKIATLPKVQSLPSFKNMKFRVENEEHSKQIQEYLFSIGYKWLGGSVYHVINSDARYFITSYDGNITWINNSNNFNDSVAQEYKLTSHTTYSIEPVISEIEVVNILGKQYNKADVEDLLKTMKEVK